MLDLRKILSSSPSRMEKTASADATLASDLSHPEARARVQEALEEAYRQGAQSQLQKTAAREAALDQLYGDVVVSACMHQLVLSKMAMSQNLCWECRQEPVSPRSAYRRCLTCDAKNQEGR